MCPLQYNNKKHFLFISLALNQTLFYIKLSKKIKDHGYKVTVFNFHEASSQLLRDHEIDCVDVHSKVSGFSQDLVEKEFNKQIEKLNVEYPQLLLSHEKKAFNLNDEELLKEKFVQFSKVFQNTLPSILRESQNVVAFQELGGFVSVLTAFYNFRYYGIDNYFAEPSFFRGRFLLQKNTIKAPKINSITLESEVTEEVLVYLKNTKDSGSLVIPEKDKSHFQNPLKKILSRRNINRLIEKSWEKYARKQKEEFNHIGYHVKKHLKMLLNEALLKRIERPLPETKFVYFPLHVPADVALTIRSPEYLDQLSLIDYIARCVPLNYLLCVKEHPALVGGVEFDKVKELIKRNQNIVWLDHKINNLEVLESASAVITINSKSGAEALMMGTPVLCLGDAFYNTFSQVKTLDKYNELPNVIKDIDTWARPDERHVNRFFQDVYNSSWPGEIYGLEDANIEVFALSLIKSIGESLEVKTEDESIEKGFHRAID